MKEPPREPPLGLEVDVDVRLHDVWVMMWGADFYTSMEEKLRPDVARMLRGVYLMGYRDALLELEAGKPGVLNDEHNIKLI